MERQTTRPGARLRQHLGPRCLVPNFALCGVSDCSMCIGAKEGIGGWAEKGGPRAFEGSWALGVGMRRKIGQANSGLNFFPLADRLQFFYLLIRPPTREESYPHLHEGQATQLRH